MTFHTRRLVTGASLLAVLAAGGCGGGGGSTSSEPAATGNTASSAGTPTTRPGVPAKPGTGPRTTPSGGGSSATGGTTPSEPIRVPVTLTFTRPGRVEPPTVTIPPLVPIQLTLISRDGGAHALALSSNGRTYTLRVRAGGQASTRIPGVPVGRYRLTPRGDGPGVTLIVGGRVGP